MSNSKVVVFQRLKKWKLVLAIIFFPITAILFLVDGLIEYTLVISVTGFNSFLGSYGFKRISFFEIMRNQISNTAYNAFYDWIVSTDDKAYKYPNYAMKRRDKYD